MRENVDLSFVSPFVRDIVVKRIEAIEQFSTKPGRMEAERHAADLGLKVAQFYKLVTKWQQTHDPVTLAPKGNPRPHRVHSLCRSRPLAWAAASAASFFSQRSAACASASAA